MGQQNWQETDSWYIIDDIPPMGKKPRRGGKDEPLNAQPSGQRPKLGVETVEGGVSELVHLDDRGMRIDLHNQ